jgi:hypothetical protein
MQTAIKIDFHGASGSDAIAQNIEKHVAELEDMDGRLTACHVSLEPPITASEKADYST